MLVFSCVLCVYMFLICSTGFETFFFHWIFVDRQHMFLLFICTKFLRQAMISHYVRASRFFLYLIPTLVGFLGSYCQAMRGNFFPIVSLPNGLVRCLLWRVGRSVLLVSVSQTSNQTLLGWFSAAPSIGSFPETTATGRLGPFLFAWFIAWTVKWVP